MSPIIYYGGVIALFLFILGFAIRFARIFSFYKKKDKPEEPAPKSKKSILKGILYTLKEVTVGWFSPFRFERGGRVSVLYVPSVIMHITIIIVLIFGPAAHMVFWSRLFGQSSYPVLPMSFSDALTILAMISVALLLSRRAIFTLTKSPMAGISGVSDFFWLVILLLAIIFGYLAVHNIGDYSLLLSAHYISVEILVALTPWTKMSHVVLGWVSKGLYGWESGTG